MAILHPQRTPLEKPVDRWEIDAGSPFAVGLVACLPLSEGGGGARDLVRGIRTTTPPVWTPRRRGIAGREWIFSASATAHLNFTAAPFSVFTAFRITGTLKTAGLRFGALCRYAYTSVGNNQGWYLGAHTATFAFARYANGAGLGLLLSTTTRAIDTDYTLAGTTDGTTSRIYVNGLEEATSVTSPVPLSAPTADFKNIISTSSGTSEYHDVYVAYIWNRLVSADEIRYLNAFPFAPLRRASSPRVFSFPPIESISGRPPKTSEEDSQLADIAMAMQAAGLLVVEIQDDTGAWTSFSARGQGVRECRHVVKVGSVVHDSERASGIFQTQTLTLEMDNRPPLNGGHGWWNTWNAVRTATDPNGTTHSFSNLYRRKVRLSSLAVTASEGYVSRPLAVMLIDDVSAGSDKDTVSLRLVGLSKKLQEESADRVKDGEDWYRSRPIGWLARRLVERAYPDPTIFESGSPPSRISISTHDGSRQFSSFGQPPEWDGSSWLDQGYVARCVVWDQSTYLYVGFETKPGDPFNAAAFPNGNNGRLYRYTIATDTWTWLADFDAPIQYLTLRTGPSRLFIVTWRPNTAGTVQERCADAKVFWYNISTGATTTLVGATTADPLWPSGWYYRKGNADLGAYWIGDTGVGRENDPIHVPYEHAIRTHTGGGYYVRHSNESLSDAYDSTQTYPVSGNTLPWEAQIARGYAHFKAASLSTPDMKVRASHRHLCDTAKQARTTSRYLYWITWDGTNWKLNRIDMDTAPYTRSSVTLSWTGVTDPMYERSIMSWCLSDDAATIFISCVDWNEATIGGKATSYLWRGTINNATFGVTLDVAARWSETETASGAGYVTRTLLDMAAYGTSGAGLYVHGCYVDRRNARGTPYGIFAWSDDSGGTMLIDGLSVNPRSQGPFSGWAYLVESTIPYWYYCDTATGVWWKHRADTSAPTPAVQSNGRPHVDASPSISSWPVWVGTAPSRLFGFSAPGSPPWQHVTPSDYANGIHWMFHLSTGLTDRVALADFSDLKIWDALSLLVRKAGDYEMGFSEGGQFYFRARPSAGSASATLRPYGPWGTLPGSGYLYFPCKSVAVAPDYAGVYNVAEVTPYVVKYAAPEGSFEKTTESEFNARERIVVSLNQNGTRKQQVILVCALRGSIGQDLDDADVNQSKAPRFRVIQYRAIIETQTTEAISSSQTVFTVANISDMEVGDSIAVLGGTAKAISAVNRETRQVTIPSGGFGTAYPVVGSEVRVYKGAHSKPSDDPSGVCTVTDSGWASGGGTAIKVSATERIQVGSIIKGLQEECLVTAIDRTTYGPSNYMLTVIRGANGTFLETHASGKAVTVFWCPREFDRAYPIEDTGLSVLFMTDGTATAEERMVLEGDRFVVTAPGLSLEAQERGKAVALDSTSIDRWGRKPYPPIQNRFLGYVYADAIAAAIVTANKNPKLLFTVPAPFMDSVAYGLGKSLYVEDQHTIYLPNTYAEVAVTGYTYNPSTDEATYKLRSVASVTNA